MPQPNTNTELREQIIEFLSNTDVDFGYATGNLNMDTKKESRDHLIDRLEELITSHNKKLELSAKLDEHKYEVLDATTRAIDDEQNGEGSGIAIFDNWRAGRYHELKAELSNLEGEKT